MIKKTEQEVMQYWNGDINTPLVSVCTISYNHEKYITEALDSFLMQETSFPFELVIADDHSFDGTASVITKYIEKFPKIIKANLRVENVGAMTNFIDNMKRAKGKYIALCEGDDYWTDPLKLQKQVDFLENNTEYVISYHSSQPFNNEGDLLIDFGGAKRDLESYEMQQATPINTLTVCFRNVLTTYPYEMNFTKIGDLFLWALLSEFGKGKFLNDIKPAKYRVHSGGIYSQIKRDERLYMRFTLNSALLSYHHRMGNIESEMYFKKLIFRSFFSSKFIFLESFNIFKIRFHITLVKFLKKFSFKKVIL